VTINSDDPAYFGGYLTENFLAVQKALRLDRADIDRLVRNSFQAAFLRQDEKQVLLDELDNEQFNVSERTAGKPADWRRE
jgi:adenine deaminase